MDAFISRKKRKLSNSSQLATQTPDLQPTSQSNSSNIDNNLATPEDSETESTDFKLALLSSLHPDTDQQLLLDVLLAHEGSVLEASSALSADRARNNSPLPPRKTNLNSSKAGAVAALGYQSSLSNFVSQPSTTSDHTSTPKPKLLSKRGQTLHLYSPSDISLHTPCTIIHNFLPVEVANALLVELLGESETFERSTFKLFDNVVRSPHTSCFYVEGLEEVREKRAEYVYNGGVIEDIRQLTPRMLAISPLVESAVNTAIQHRQTLNPSGQKLKHQSPDPWTPNVAFVNCYNGPTESVGYHSDQLTYLGPRAVIGSISLGVAREFRVRRVVPVDDDDSSLPSPGPNTPASKEEKDKGDAAGQISIHLPHNSLLIMHASMQEEWKHAIAPSPSITPHPISGNKRINITYREYKPYLHPRFTPRCKCDVAAVLRVVQRKRRGWGRYFWMCYAGNVPGKEGCSFFEWAVFDEDGRPVWKNAGAGAVGKERAVGAEDA